VRAVKTYLVSNKRDIARRRRRKQKGKDSKVIDCLKQIQEARLKPTWYPLNATSPVGVANETAAVRPANWPAITSKTRIDASLADHVSVRVVAPSSPTNTLFEAAVVTTRETDAVRAAIAIGCTLAYRKERKE
jgi:hypothetical protein